MQRTHLRKLDIVMIELLLHNLLQYPQDECLGLLKRHLLDKDISNAKRVPRREERTLCHLSWSSLCAASEPEPIAFASYRTKVPEGSVWNLYNPSYPNNPNKHTTSTHSCGPNSSIPAISSATPNGRLIIASSSCTLSPNRSARSHTACVTLSTLMRSS